MKYLFLSTTEKVKYQDYLISLVSLLHSVSPQAKFALFLALLGLEKVPLNQL